MRTRSLLNEEDEISTNSSVNSADLEEAQRASLKEIEKGVDKVDLVGARLTATKKRVVLSDDERDHVRDDLPPSHLEVGRAGKERLMEPECEGTEAGVPPSPKGGIVLENLELGKSAKVVVDKDDVVILDPTLTAKELR